VRERTNEFVRKVVDAMGVVEKKARK